MTAHTCELGVHPILASNRGTCPACQELVECPICRGEGILSNGNPDPQQREDDSCWACSEGGSVTEQHRQELIAAMTDDARDALARFEQHRDEIDRLLQQELADRDREWWS